MFGPLSFHPTQDIISIYDVYRARGGAYVGRWTPFNYGDLTALPMPVVQEQIRAAASQIIEITIPRRSSESSITSELSITSNIIIMEGLGDGTYPLVNGLLYGLKPYWNSSRPAIKRHYYNQVAFIHEGTMYMAQGDPRRSDPILVQDLTGTSPAMVTEMSQLCHRAVDPEGSFSWFELLTNAGICRGALLGDGTFLVHIGSTHINVWCFDEAVPLWIEELAYARKAKNAALKRKYKRKRKAFKADTRGFLRKPWMDLKTKRVPKSSCKMAATSPEPEEGSRITEALGEMDGRNAAQGHSSNQRAKKRFSLRRGVYKLAVKTVGRIL